MYLRDISNYLMNSQILITNRIISAFLTAVWPFYSELKEITL